MIYASVCFWSMCKINGVSAPAFTIYYLLYRELPQCFSKDIIFPAFHWLDMEAHTEDTH